MSVTISEGSFEIAKNAIWDADLETWCVRFGIKSRTGKLILHMTAHGRSPQIAMTRAVVYCQIMTAMRPPNS